MARTGRPKKEKVNEELCFNSFLEDITLFRNYLEDVINQERDIFNEEQEDPNIKFIQKFLSIDIWKQNLFIVYMLNRDKKAKNVAYSFKALAELLNVERTELMKVLREIKKELIKE